MNTIVEKKK